MGIDVHAESWHVTMLAAGEELFHGRIPGEYSALRKMLTRRVACQIRVAYEAGPCGFGWYDRLQADGLEVLVVAPSLIPVESGNRSLARHSSKSTFCVLRPVNFGIKWYKAPTTIQ